MRHRFANLALPALLAMLVLLVAGCGADAPPDQGAGPATTADAGPDPTAAPTTTRKDAEPATRPAPDGVVPADRRQPAPDLNVTAFDGRTVTMGGFRGQPAVVNFFESW